VKYLWHSTVSVFTPVDYGKPKITAYRL